MIIRTVKSIWLGLHDLPSSRLTSGSAIHVSQPPTPNNSWSAIAYYINGQSPPIHISWVAGNSRIAEALSLGRGEMNLIGVIVPAGDANREPTGANAECGLALGKALRLLDFVSFAMMTLVSANDGHTVLRTGHSSRLDEAVANGISDN